MNLLLDTYLLLWAASAPRRLSRAAVKLINDPKNQLYFSAASVWEVVIKNGLQRVTLVRSSGCDVYVPLALQSNPIFSRMMALSSVSMRPFRFRS